MNPSSFETNPPGHRSAVLSWYEPTKAARCMHLATHAFKNNTDQPIRVFMDIAPAGFEHFFAEVAEEWAQPERDMSRITAISEKYGIHSA